MSYFGNAVYPLPLVNPGNIVTTATSAALSEASYGKTYILTAASTITMTLPPLLANSITKSISLINDSVAGVATINTSGSDTIRVQGVGVSSFTLIAGDVIILENNGATWSVADNSSWKANTTGSPSQVFNAAPGTSASNVVTVAQAQSSSLYTAVATGSSDALVAAFTPVITTVSNQTILVRASAANTTTTPTINPGSGVITIVKGNNQPLAIGDISGAGHWLELTLDSTLTKAVLQNPAGGIATPSYGKRQTVMSGPVDVNGVANEIGVGTGLAPTLIGAVTPVALTFAAGFGVNGGVDYNSLISSTLSFPAVPASNLSYLTVDRNTSTGASTLGSTLAPVQYGGVYNRAAQSCLSLNNIGTDDFGNTWTNTAVTFSNTTPIVAGTYMGVFNGTSSNFTTTSITSLGNGSWTARLKFKPTAVASQATLFTFAPSISVGFGVQLGFISSKLSLSFSSNGSSWDIANAVAGNTTLVVGTSYDVEVTYDSVGGKYYCYLNGVAESNLTITSASKIAPFGVIAIGSQANSAFYYSGSAQGFEILPYCVHPNGVTFTPATTLANVATQGYASDWFNTANYTMNQVSAASTVAGTNPTFTTKQRLYVGEATAGASTVSSAVSYAYNRTYVSPDTTFAGLGTKMVFSTNLGVTFGVYNRVDGVCQASINGWLPGEVVYSIQPAFNSGSYITNYAGTGQDTRNVASYTTGASYVFMYVAKTDGTQSTATTNWKARMTSTTTW